MSKYNADQYQITDYKTVVEFIHGPLDEVKDEETAVLWDLPKSFRLKKLKACSTAGEYEYRVTGEGFESVEELMTEVARYEQAKKDAYDDAYADIYLEEMADAAYYANL